MVSPRNSRSKSLMHFKECGQECRNGPGATTTSRQRDRHHDTAGSFLDVSEFLACRPSGSSGRSGHLIVFTSVREILHCEESNDNWGSWQEIPFRADRLPGAHSHFCNTKSNIMLPCKERKLAAGFWE